MWKKLWNKDEWGTVACEVEVEKNSKKLADSKEGREIAGGNGTDREREKKIVAEEERGRKAGGARWVRERRCRTRRMRGVRPELDRIGELVITEAGDSPGTSASLPRAST